MNWIIRLFCIHSYKFHRNIHGDEIILLRWKRSISKCEKCGKLKYLQHLQIEGELK